MKRRTYAADVPIGRTFTTPGGFKYRIMRHGIGGVVVREVTLRHKTITTSEGETVTFAADSTQFIISNGTEVASIDAPAPDGADEKLVSFQSKRHSIRIVDDSNE